MDTNTSDEFETAWSSTPEGEPTPAPEGSVMPKEPSQNDVPSSNDVPAYSIENNPEVPETNKSRASLLALPTIDEDETPTTSPVEVPSAPAAADNPATGGDTAAMASDDFLPELDALADMPLAEGVQGTGPRFPWTTAASGHGSTAKRVLLAAAAVTAALGLIYGGVGLYFTSHFMPNTTVNGDEVSGMSVEDLSAYVTELGTRYETRVTGDGLDFTIPGSSIDVNYDGNAYGAQAAAQIPAWSWPMELMESHEYHVDQGISFNQEKLSAAVATVVDEANATATPPVNATMAFDEGTKAFVAVPEQLGTAINRDAVIIAVTNGVSTLQEQITLADPELIQPTITTADERLTASVEKANMLIDSNIVLRIAGNDATSVDAARIREWLSVDGECNLLVNHDAIREWAQGPLSEEFDSIARPRSFTRPDGKQVEIEGGTGTYGWSIDGAALADVLTQALNETRTDPIDVPMRSTADSWNPGGKEWPNRYVDVDLGEQHVRMYDDASNVIWESDCVSANTSEGHSTPAGVFFIEEKRSPMVLIGLDYNHDGQPDYETPVTYWMPFYESAFGLHDASWRGAFGGSIYTYNGSHGCVNLPYGKAQELYAIINTGDVVVVHW